VLHRNRCGGGRAELPQLAWGVLVLIKKEGGREGRDEWVFCCVVPSCVLARDGGKEDGLCCREIDARKVELDCFY